MLVGNKSDLENQRKIPKEMGELFAEEEGLLFGEASAKSGEGVEGLFMEIGTFSPSLFFISFGLLVRIPSFFLVLVLQSGLELYEIKRGIECVERY
jgi:hypothetical protein